MIAFARQATRLALPAMLAASFLAGCGAHGVTLAASTARAAALNAKAVSTTPGSRKLVKPLASAQTVPMLQNLSRKLAASPVNLPPVNTPAAQSARVQQATIEDDAEAGAKKQDEVDALLDLMTAYGYGGDRRHMVKAIHDVVYQYVLANDDPSNPDYYAPDGWDPAIHDPRAAETKLADRDHLADHFCHWLPNFNVPLASPQDYASQSLLIAQSRQAVRYYVWVSKPSAAFWASQTGDPTCNAVPLGTQDPNNPFANVMDFAPIFSETTGFNIVKGSDRGTWLVNITAMPGHGQKVGKIQDYLQTSSEADLDDLGHFVAIPPQLYF